ncbi:MAG: putative glycoside hydrolase [Thermodesulfovibrionales bacterium]|nr:putative glycoside hydrolase [Thermodesulfovibrionales bacterium]
MRAYLSKEYKKLIIVLLVLLSLSAPGYAMGYTTGRVIDFVTGKPVGGAFVTLDNNIVLTDENGMFVLKNMGNKIAVRAYGYLRNEQIIVAPLITLPLEIKLMPFTPKALYLSPYGIGSRVLRGSALRLIEETELNALVIDIKGDRGFIPYKSSVPLAREVGAQKIITVRDMNDLIKSLKEKGIYLIARIVVFKDNPLALTRPDLSIKTASGEIWRDGEDLAWVDPFRKEAWNYNINIAVEAAQYGFDEIQFDYVRFPDTAGLKFSMESTEENRVKAISGFLMEAKKRLMPYNVFLAADIFGYVCWNLNDTKIGQRLENLVSSVDYMSPMLYPSGFHFGIPGYRNPVAYPYEIVYLSIKRAQERTNISPLRFRPWLQAFSDYAFDKRRFTGREIREQINAAEKFGSNGWMLWNSHNIYSGDGLKKTL